MKIISLEPSGGVYIVLCVVLLCVLSGLDIVYYGTKKNNRYYI